MAVTYSLPHDSGRGPALDLARELNPEQLAAATAPPGPALVIAGAGSGKTRTLIFRVAHLVQSGTDPGRILLLTFTNKAAREMMRRVGDLLPLDLSRMWGGTFHHIGHRLLRRHTSEAGLEQDFTILDRDDATDLLADSIPAIGVNPKEKRFPKASAILELVSFAANTRRTIPDVLAGEFDYLGEFEEELNRLGAEYIRRKRASNAVDYDDLLTLPVRLLENNPGILETARRRWSCVLVDEYQDTNAVQAALVDLVAGGHRHVMAVGDDAQSIYSWRGANFENILTFPNRYPGAAVFRVETNYRSTPEILGLANASIAHNTRQFPKNLRSGRPGGMRPALVPLEDAHRQAAFIAERVLDLHENGMPLSSIAVLYRAHSHAIELQIELVRRRIPFLITSGVQFFEQAHVKDVAAFLRAAVNPHDEISFKRIARLLTGIGNRGAAKLWEFCAGKASWHGGPAPRKAAAAWEQIAALMGQLRASPAPSPATMIEWTLEGAYRDYLKLRFDNFAQRLDDLQQMREFSRQFESTTDFLAQLALLTGLDTPGNEPAARGPDADRLKLSTVHQAKGLEWRAVFVIMLCDGLFPLGRAMENDAGLEEERRLFYVAATRAQDELYLTWPAMRFGRGPSADIFQRRSRFLDELPPESMETWNVTADSPAPAPTSDEPF